MTSLITARRQNDDDLDYIRGRYGVPAERGRRITFRWRKKDGTILGAQPNARHYLSVLLDGEAEPVILHPTWEIVYHDEVRS